MNCSFCDNSAIWNAVILETAGPTDTVGWWTLIPICSDHQEAAESITGFARIEEFPERVTEHRRKLRRTQKAIKRALLADENKLGQW